MSFRRLGTAKVTTFLALFVLLSAQAPLVGCNPAGTSSARDNVIVIGTDFATSGADAPAGVPTQNGAVLAIEQEAARGLPGGYELRAQTMDDAVNGVHDPAQGVRNVQALIQDSRVLAIVGGMNSSVAQAEIPVASQERIALLSPSATSVGLTAASSGFRSFFRTVVRDDLQGAADADFAFWVLHARRAYVIDDAEAYGKGIADVFARRLERDGGTVLDRQHLFAGQQDFTALLTRALGTKPDLVYYGGVVSTGGALLRRQMLALHMSATLMGGDGLCDPGFISAAGAAADGTYCSKGAPNLTAMPAARHYLKDYAARFPGQSVGTYSANAYAAAYVAIETIRALMGKNGGVPPKRQALAQAIAASLTTNTPIGKVAFTSSGDIATPLVSMWVVRNGQFAFISQRSTSLQ